MHACSGRITGKQEGNGFFRNAEKPKITFNITVGQAI